MNKFALLFLLILPFAINGQDQDKYYGGDNGKKLDWVMYYLTENYVDSTDNDFLADIAIKRIVEELDPYSVYQTKKELEDQNNKDNGFAPKGIGFNYYLLDGTRPIVTHITIGGPADKVGIKKGFQLHTINNKSLAGKNYNQISEMLHDEKDESLTLLFFDHDNNMNTYLLVKDNLPYYSVESGYMLTSKIGYIKISRFTQKTMEEVLAKIAALTYEGMENLVIDLRGNSGGVKDQAIQLADNFLNENKLIHTAEGFNIEKEDHNSTSKGSFKNGKLVILTDKWTASASEIFTAALQDWDRALVLGKPTFGKGLIQQSYKLGDGSAIRLTVGRFYTPQGRPLQKPMGENWFDEFKNSVPENGYISQMAIPSEYMSKTKGNRKIVAGKGGIFPDIYFNQPEPDMRAFNRYNDGGYIYGFASYYVAGNRKTITQRFSNSTQFRNDMAIDRELSEAFREYIAFNGFAEAKDPKDFGTPRVVIDKVKAWMAGQIWDDNAYYELTNNYDPIIAKAIEVLNDETFKTFRIKG